MLIKISDIVVKPGRREIDAEHVKELAESIAASTLLNPITVDRKLILIAGLHRLEAAKSLGFTEIECNVTSLEGLRADLAEIDENVIRKGLPTIEYDNLLLKRKEIYETLHPYTKRGGDPTSKKSKLAKCEFGSQRSFVQDTAEKVGVSPATVWRQVQTAKNLTEGAKNTLITSAVKITQKDAAKLSRLPAEQQEEAATQLADGTIKSINDYQAPLAPQKAEDISESKEVNQQEEKQASTSEKRFSSFKESVADLKDPHKDCSCTTDSFIAEISAFVHQFQKGIKWYDQPYYAVVFPLLAKEQLDYLRKQIDTICTEAEHLYDIVERNNEI